MDTLFFGSLVGIIISGLLSFVLGLTCVINCSKEEDPSIKKQKRSNGIKAIVMGSIISCIFTPLVILINRGLDTLIWLLSILYFPIFAIMIILGFSYFLVVGINSLRLGMRRKEEGIYDTDLMVLGIFSIIVAFVVSVSLILSLASSFSIWQRGLRPSKTKSSSSSAQPYSYSLIKDYLFSVIYK